MNTPPRGKSLEQIDALVRLLRAGPDNAASICARLGISQPTFSRLKERAIASGARIVTLGALKSSRYGLARDAHELGHRIPVYRVSADGLPAPFGEFITLAGDWNAFIPTYREAGEASYELHEGLPFWLADLRPQGYLGRMVPRQHEDLALPRDINDWSDDHTLMYLARRGENVFGDVIIGNEALSRYVTHGRRGENLVPNEDARAALYPAYADRANAGDPPGSSAGGEQPKFTAAVLRADMSVCHVLVKFSPPTDSPAGQRWADLLICEHLALETLRAEGRAASKSHIVAGGGRVFLEVERFDRIGSAGRAPMVSFAGIDTLFGALDRPWSDRAQMLFDRGALPQRDLDNVRFIEVFGALIGNTDRHSGNLSFAWARPAKFSLLPAYDTLPMMYRPSQQGEVVPRTFSPRMLDRVDMRFFDDGLRVARLFWRAAIGNAMISDGFKQVAANHLASIEALRPGFLPA